MTIGFVNTSMADVGAERGADMSRRRQNGGNRSRYSATRSTIHLMTLRQRHRNHTTRHTQLKAIIKHSPSQRAETLKDASFQYLPLRGVQTTSFSEQPPETLKYKGIPKVGDPGYRSEARVE